jgi:hypothetical protein
MVLVTCYPLNAIDPGTPWRLLVTTELIGDRPAVVASGQRMFGGMRADQTQIAGRPTGWTQEQKPLGSAASAFASAVADGAGTARPGQDMGGLSGRWTLPRERGRRVAVEDFAPPRARDGRPVAGSS